MISAGVFVIYYRKKRKWNTFPVGQSDVQYRKMIDCGKPSRRKLTQDDLTNYWYHYYKRKQLAEEAEGIRVNLSARGYR